MSNRNIPLTRPRGSVGRGAEACVDPGVIDGYLRDASGEVGTADAVFRPGSEADIAVVLRRAHREGIGVTVVACQTSTTASSVPREGWVLSTEKFVGIGAIDAPGLSAVCAAGEVLGVFQDRLAEDRLLYPPDPTSRYECSLGGSIACNASGPRSHRYGATRNWVRALRIVLSCGEVLEVRRGDWVVARGEAFQLEHAEEPEVCALHGGDGHDAVSLRSIRVPGFSLPAGIKHAVGYLGGDEVDLIDLFIGSEGTLGVVTEVEVELVPAPAGCFSFLAFFGSESGALDLIERTRADASQRTALRPDSLEWFDRASLDLIASAMPDFEVPGRAAVALFVEQMTGDDDQPGNSNLAEEWFALLDDCGALVDRAGGVRVALTFDQRDELRRVRHAVPTGVNERAARNGMPKLGTDLAVADGDLRNVVALYHQAAQSPVDLLDSATADSLRRELDAEVLPERLDAVTFGHVGDNHLHMNFLPRNPGELLLARTVYAELARRVIAMGGSVSAEHGIGKTKRAALRQQVGESGYADMLAVKRALDPGHVLGRGNLFEEAELS